jgi:hypothetical protein
MERAHANYCASVSSRLVGARGDDALGVIRGVEHARVSGLATLSGENAGPAALSPLKDARPGIWLLHASSRILAGPLALVSVKAASRFNPTSATAKAVATTNALGADCSCSGQNDSHGGDERDELHPVLVAIVG